MKMEKKDLKKVAIVTFEPTLYEELSAAKISETAYIAVGIIEDDVFLDIKTGMIYPFARMIEDELETIPIFHLPYVFRMTDYEPKTKEEEIEILKEAERAHLIYQMNLELEKKGKIISFQKQKWKKRGEKKDYFKE